MKIIKIFFVIMLLLFSGPAWSSGDWYWEGGANGLQRSYSGSHYYDDLVGFGVQIARDYLEQSSFKVGYNFNERRYKSGLGEAPSEMRENVVFFGVSRNHFPDAIPGKLTLRLDGYVGQDEYNNFSIPTSGPMGGGTRRVSVVDSFAVLSPTIAFLNNAKTFYLDLGFAYSIYSSGDSENYNVNITHSQKNIVSGGSSTDDIDVMQWTPSIGFGFNRSADWLQLRSYLIDYSSSNRVDFKDSTAALEAKWIHWFSMNPIFGMDSASLILLSGERIYAVDSDSYSLYNFADMQTDSIAISAKWKLDNQLSLIAQGGYEGFEDLIEDNKYESFYLFAQLSKNW